MVLKILCFLLGTSFLSHATAFEIPEGCFVRNEIEEKNLQFGTLDFFVFNNDVKEKNTTIVLNCNNDDYDLINIGSSQLIQQRFRSQTEVMREFYNDTDYPDIKYWKGFQIGLFENLTLVDEDNKSWLPKKAKHNSLNCSIKSVKISQGNFTRFCPQRTPTWKVLAGKEQEIPLQSNLQRQRLTLISGKPFQPSFNLCGTGIQIGSSNGKMVIGTSVDLLPPGKQELILEILNESSSLSIQVLDGDGNTVHTSPLKEAPTKLMFKGRDSDNFLISQHLVEPVLKKEEVTPNPVCCLVTSYYTVSIALGGCLLLSIILMLACIHNYQLRQRMVKMVFKETTMNQHKSAATTQSGKIPFKGSPHVQRHHQARQQSTSALNVMHLTVSPPVPPLFTSKLRHPNKGHQAPPEEVVYCEMHPIPGVRPPNSFDLGEEYGCVETINDVYESADDVL